MTLPAAVRAQADLRTAERLYRLAVLAAVEEHGFAAVGRELGLSRQAVRQLALRAESMPAPAGIVAWVGPGGAGELEPSEPVAESVAPFDVDAARARLAELDARYDKLVDAVAARDKPAPMVLQNDQRIRNGQAKRRRRKGLGRLPTVREEIRGTAESKLLRFLEDNRGKPLVDRIIAELDEAAGLREAVLAFEEAGRGF